MWDFGDCKPTNQLSRQRTNRGKVKGEIDGGRLAVSESANLCGCHWNPSPCIPRTIVPFSSAIRPHLCAGARHCSAKPIELRIIFLSWTRTVNQLSCQNQNPRMHDQMHRQDDRICHQYGRASWKSYPSNCKSIAIREEKGLVD